MEPDEKPHLEHKEKPNVEPGYNLVALSLGFEARDTALKQQGSHVVAAEASPPLQSGNIVQAMDSCTSQVDLLAAAIPCSTLPPNGSFGSGGSSVVPGSPMRPTSNTMVTPCRSSSIDGQSIAPLAATSIPGSSTWVSNESRGPIPDSTPPLPNITSIVMESSPSLPEQKGSPLKKEESSAADKCKVRKRPRQLLQDARARDVNKSSEKHSVIRWKDVWVAQLIHIRGRMHTTFTSPQRQRVDLWQIVKHEMANSCFGFDKDSEACRKKWVRVYKEYKDDLHLSSDERAQKCRFYDLVDFYMGNKARANGLCSMPAHQDLILASQEMVVAASPDAVNVKANQLNLKAGDTQGGAMVHQSTSNGNGVLVHNLPPDAATKKPRIIENAPSSIGERPCPPLEASPKKLYVKSPVGSVQTMLSELVNIGKEMLHTTREFEKEKLAVLHSIKDTLGKIAKKI